MASITNANNFLGNWHELDVLAAVVSRYEGPKVAQKVPSPEHRISCHRCGNIRKRRTLCCRPSCPHTFCGRCCEKLKDEYGANVFKDGCPVCKELCCCYSKSIYCHRKNHCYRKCPTSKFKHVSNLRQDDSENEENVTDKITVLSERHKAHKVPELHIQPNEQPEGMINLLAAIAGIEKNTAIEMCDNATNLRKEIDPDIEQKCVQTSEIDTVVSAATGMNVPQQQREQCAHTDILSGANAGPNCISNATSCISSTLTTPNNVNSVGGSDCNESTATLATSLVCQNIDQNLPRELLNNGEYPTAGVAAFVQTAVSPLLADGSHADDNNSSSLQPTIEVASGKYGNHLSTTDSENLNGIDVVKISRGSTETPKKAFSSCANIVSVTSLPTDREFATLLNTKKCRTASATQIKKLIAELSMDEILGRKQTQKAVTSHVTGVEHTISGQCSVTSTSLAPSSNTKIENINRANFAHNGRTVSPAEANCGRVGSTEKRGAAAMLEMAIPTEEDPTRNTCDNLGTGLATIRAKAHRDKRECLPNSSKRARANSCSPSNQATLSPTASLMNVKHCATLESSSGMLDEFSAKKSAALENIYCNTGDYRRDYTVGSNSSSSSNSSVVEAERKCLEVNAINSNLSKNVPGCATSDTLSNATDGDAYALGTTAALHPMNLLALVSSFSQNMAK